MFFPACKLISSLSIYNLGEGYKSVWTSTLRYSDCRRSCTPFATYISPFTSDHLWSHDVPPQWQFIAADGPKVILHQNILIQKRFYGICKVVNTWKKFLHGMMQRMEIAVLLGLSQVITFFFLASICLPFLVTPNDAVTILLSFLSFISLGPKEKI